MSEDQHQTIRFIQEYKSFPLLWDVNHKDHSNKIKRNNAIKTMSIKFNMDPAAVRLKIKNLRSYFLKEHHKVLRRKFDSDMEGYYSSWFAYEMLLFISNSTRKNRKSKSDPKNLDIHENNVQDNITFDSMRSISCLSNSVSENHKFVQPKMKRSMTKYDVNEKEKVVYKLIKLSTGDIVEVDELNSFQSFCNYIVDKMTRLKPMNQILAQREISNILTELEISEIETNLVQN